MLQQRLEEEGKVVNSENAGLKQDTVNAKQSYSRLAQKAVTAEQEHLALQAELAASRSESSELAEDIASVQNARLKEGFWVLTSKILKLNVEIVVTRNDDTALYNELSDV